MQEQEQVGCDLKKNRSYRSYRSYYDPAPAPGASTDNALKVWLFRALQLEMCGVCTRFVYSRSAMIVTSSVVEFFAIIVSRSSARSVFEF